MNSPTVGLVTKKLATVHLVDWPKSTKDWKHFDGKWIKNGEKIGYRAVALVKDVLSSSSRLWCLIQLVYS